MWPVREISMWQLGANVRAKRQGQPHGYVPLVRMINGGAQKIKTFFFALYVLYLYCMARISDAGDGAGDLGVNLRRGTFSAAASHGLQPHAGSTLRW